MDPPRYATLTAFQEQFLEVKIYNDMEESPDAAEVIPKLSNGAVKNEHRSNEPAPGAAQETQEEQARSPWNAIASWFNRSTRPPRAQTGVIYQSVSTQTSSYKADHVPNLPPQPQRQLDHRARKRREGIFWLPDELLIGIMVFLPKDLYILRQASYPFAMLFADKGFHKKTEVVRKAMGRRLRLSVLGR